MNKRVFIIIVCFIFLRCDFNDTMKDHSPDSSNTDSIGKEAFNYPTSYHVDTIIEDNLIIVTTDSLNYKLKTKYYGDTLIQKHVIDTLSKLDSVFVYDIINGLLIKEMLVSYPNNIPVGDCIYSSEKGIDSIVNLEKDYLVNYYAAIEIAASHGLNMPNIEVMESFGLLEEFDEMLWYIRETDQFQDSIHADTVLIIGSESGFVGFLENKSPSIVDSKVLKEYKNFIKKL